MTKHSRISRASRPFPIVRLLTRLDQYPAGLTYAWYSHDLWQTALATYWRKVFTQSAFSRFKKKKKDHWHWASGSPCSCMSQHKLVKPLCQTLSRREGESQPQAGLALIPKHRTRSFSAGSQFKQSSLSRCFLKGFWSWLCFYYFQCSPLFYGRDV